MAHCSQSNITIRFQWAALSRAQTLFCSGPTGRAFNRPLRTTPDAAALWPLPAPSSQDYRRKNWCGTWFTRRQSSSSNTPNTAHLAVRFKDVLFIGCLRSFGVWAVSPIPDPLRDRRRGFIDSERDRFFESLWPGDQHTDATPERVSLRSSLHTAERRAFRRPPRPPRCAPVG